MDQVVYDSYLTLLQNELVSAMGCTEPIAVALAAAKAKEVLGAMPSAITIDCSPNIIKNVKGVTVPNSGGLIGIEIAAILGALGGSSVDELEILQKITPEQQKQAKKLLDSGICNCGVIPDVEGLLIIATVTDGENSVTVELKTSHTNITRIEKNGEVLLSEDEGESKIEEANPEHLNIKEIIEFANTVKLDEVREIMNRQIEQNTNISVAGLTGDWGAQVGKTLLKYDGNDVRVRARAAAAAGSDARMSGCSMPVVINSGSGNQGITVSLPVIEYAKELKATEEQTIRALVLSNLVSLFQKSYIGRLSAFCGAVSAAAGAASGIAYLHGGNYDEISRTITNTLANASGIVCDGAKPSCAAKIASAVDAATLGYLIGMEEGRAFLPGEGLVKNSVDETIESIGRLGREGMKATDVEIINIMLDN